MSDFSGLATVYNVECTDGRVIQTGAFQHQIGETVPLVWRHNHNDIRNIIGHGTLEHSDSPSGVRVRGVFNKTTEGQRAREMVLNGDIRSLSIFANEVLEHADGPNRRYVKRGTIREVSLVLVGANPGARIEDVVRHGDGVDEFFVVEGIIVHNDAPIAPEPEPAEEPDVEDTDEEDGEDDGWYTRMMAAMLDSEDEEDDEDEEDVQHEDYIQHFGVKGMRWGVRRTREQLGSAAKAAVRSQTHTKSGKFLVDTDAVKGAIKGQTHTKSGKFLVDTDAIKKDAGSLSNRVKAKAHDFVAKRQEKHAKVTQAIADDLEANGKLLESKGKAKQGDPGSQDDLRGMAKQMHKAADEYDEMAWIEATGPKAKHYAETAMEMRRFANDVEAASRGGDTVGGAKAAKQGREMREIAEQMKAESAKWAKAAAENRKKAAKYRGEAKHEEDDFSEGFIHGDTIRDILNGLSDQQKDLFNYILHSAVRGEKVPSDASNGNGGPTVGKVFDTLSAEQKTVLYYMAGSVVGDNSISQEGETTVTKNIFEPVRPNTDDASFSHADVKRLLGNAAQSRVTSLRDAFAAADVVIEHSITNIENLFPDAKNVDGGAPAFFTRPQEWVSSVLSSARRRPFSRIKSQYADLTEDAARARGYITGNQKAEQVFPVLKRVTQPQTVYKLQKLDRDDMLDITDFDVVAWLKQEMRVMLQEELARAVLIGDGRSDLSDDKIQTTNVRPIISDDPVYTISHTYNDIGNETALADMTDAELLDLIDFIAEARKDYRGAGNPVFYCSPATLTKLLLVRDTTGRRIYASQSQLAEAMRVSSIVEVPVMDALGEEDVVDPADLPAGTYDIAHLGVIVNLTDYVIGMDRGGETTFFDDFDIDFNKYTYLIETRMSGALVTPKSAIAVKLVTAKSA